MIVNYNTFRLFPYVFLNQYTKYPNTNLLFMLVYRVLFVVLFNHRNSFEFMINFRSIEFTTSATTSNGYFFLHSIGFLIAARFEEGTLMEVICFRELV